MSEDKSAVLNGCSFLIERAVNTGVCCTVSDVKLRSLLSTKDH